MDIKVIKHRNGIQFATTITIGRRSIAVDVFRNIGSPLDPAENENPLQRAFGEDGARPELAAEQEEQRQIEAGKAQLMAKVRETLQTIISAGEEAREQFGRVAVGNVKVLQPTKPDHGICCVCHEEFHLHGIAGRNDLCMKHINPSFI